MILKWGPELPGDWKTLSPVCMRVCVCTSVCICVFRCCVVECVWPQSHLSTQKLRMGLVLSCFIRMDSHGPDVVSDFDPTHSRVESPPWPAPPPATRLPTTIPPPPAKPRTRPPPPPPRLPPPESFFAAEGTLAAIPCLPGAGDDSSSG